MNNAYRSGRPFHAGEAMILTKVDTLQVSDEPLPKGDHDFRVDLIVIENDIIEWARSQRPSGVIWVSMPAEKIDVIPILGTRAKNRLN